MAQAIIAALVDNGYPAHLITVCAPSATHRDALTERYCVKSSGDNLRGAREADVVILAVQLQLYGGAAAALSPRFANRCAQR